MTRPALAPVKHVLAYPNSLKHQKLSVNPLAPTATTTKPISNGFSTSPLTKQETLEDKILYLYERQRIIDLLNEYAYTLDTTSLDLANAEVWASLFTEDCNATYPFGNHVGREGLAEYAMIAESRFKRMQVSFLTLWRSLYESVVWHNWFCSICNRTGPWHLSRMTLLTLAQHASAPTGLMTMTGLSISRKVVTIIRLSVASRRKAVITGRSRISHWILTGFWEILWASMSLERSKLIM